MAKRSGGLGKALARGFMRTAGWLYRRSGGKIGGKMFGAPVLLLTTTGRKSGRSWTVASSRVVYGRPVEDAA